MTVYIFALAFFMMGGAAAQNINLYLFGMLLPVFFLIQKHNLPLIKNLSAFRIGLCLIAMYLIFIICNVINFYFMPDVIREGAAAGLATFKVKKIIVESRLSSMCFFSGLVLMGLGGFLGTGFLGTDTCVPREGHRCLSPKNLSPKNRINTFNRALAIASVILLIYVTIQHISGFDYRSESLFMDYRKLMADGQYRALGFFSHPLSLAAGSLCLTAFYGFLLHRSLQLSAERGNALLYSIIMCCQAMCVVLSGARVAAAILFCLMILFIATLPIPKLTLQRKVILSLILLFVSLGLAFLVGLGNRMEGIFHGLREGNFFDPRFNFWKVHWQIFLENPIFGQGHALLQGFLREYYYQVYGLGSFEKHYNAHNVYLEILSDAGIVGFVVVATCVILIHRELKRATAHHPLNNLLYQSFVFAFAVNAVHGLTQNVFFDSSVFYVYGTLFWLLIWCIVYSDKRKSAE